MLGVYVSGRSREKLTAMTGKRAAGLLDRILGR